MPNGTQGRSAAIFSRGGAGFAVLCFATATAAAAPEGVGAPNGGFAARLADYYQQFKDSTGGLWTLALQAVFFAVIFVLALMAWKRFRVWSRQPKLAGATSTGSNAAAAAAIASGMKNRLVALFTSISFRRKLIEIRRLGLVGLAVVLSIALSIASFYTTYHGLLNFANSHLIALMAAIGIQGILFVASWIVARESAVHANKRRRRLKTRLEDDPRASDGVLRSVFGPLIGGLGYAVAQPFQVAMLATCMFISVFFSFDALFDQVYQEQQRVLTNRKVARSDIATALGDMHQELVTQRDALRKNLVGSKDWTDFAATIDQVAATASGAKAQIEAANNSQRMVLEGQIGAAKKDYDNAAQEAARLQAQFDTLSGNVPGATNARVDVNQAQIDVDKKTLSQRASEVDAAQKALDALKSQADDLRTKMAVEAGVGGKDKTGSRRLKGQGPVWRELNDQLKETNLEIDGAVKALKTSKDAAQAAQRQMTLDNAKIDEAAKAAQTVDQMKEQARLSLSEQSGTLATLKLKLDDLEKKYQQTEATSAEVADAAKGAFSLVDDMLDAKRRFATSGAAADYQSIVDGCGHLLELLGKTQGAKTDFNAKSCESAGVSANIQAFAAVNKSLTYFEEPAAAVAVTPEVASARSDAEAKDAAAALAEANADAPGATEQTKAAAAKARLDADGADAKYDAARATLSCAVDGDFNTFKTIDAFLNRGRYCLGQTHLSAAVLAPQRATIDRVEQENSKATSHFERTSSSLRRGDALAWLAAFIAFALDFLVLIAAILGERTLMTPLVQDGLVASKSEVDDMETENYVDTVIYPGDSTEIRNYKIFVAHVGTELINDDRVAGLHSVVDLDRADPNCAAIVGMMINSAATSDPPRAHEVVGRPNVFRIENALVRHFKRQIGLYEKEHAELHGPRDPSLGEYVQPLQEPSLRHGSTAGPRSSLLDDPFASTDPYLDADDLSDRRAPQGGPEKPAAQKPDNVVSILSAAKMNDAVNNSKPHPDVRPYY